MDEHLERLKRMCNERQRMLHDLQALLIAADKVLEHAYHATIADCGWGDRDRCQCGLTNARQDYETLKGKADAK